MKLSIVVPAYNEEATILKLLKKVNAVKLRGITKEIIVVDDGSKDKTRELLKNNKKLYNKLILKKNGGKGSAVRRGMKEATGDFLIIQDADLEYNPEDYKLMLEPIIKGEVKVTYGSRFFLTDNHKYFLPLHYFGNKFLSLISSVLFFRYISDMETCYKCMAKEVYKSLKLTENDFRIEPEITAKIIKAGYAIKEVTIHYNPRDFSEGKKISWKDGVKAAIALVKYRFT
ncbi:glycosyltransferase family 2 protein [Nanoarchaeota archaeon]